jgi:Lon protease-like protein
MSPQTLTLSSLPLFPLGTVLFPGGALPLRVFEVRYLDMVAKCHNAGAPFGVIALQQGHEVRAAGAPPEQLANIGTLAHITALERPQPGLLTVQCRGDQRFRVHQSHQLKHGLWVADVTLLPADRALAVPDDLQHTVRALRQLYAGLRAQSAAAPLPAEGHEQFDDCGWVANRWCELLPLPLAVRQHLMSLDSPLLRLELVADALGKAGIGTAPA